MLRIIVVYKLVIWKGKDEGLVSWNYFINFMLVLIFRSYLKSFDKNVGEISLVIRNRNCFFKVWERL